MRSSISSPVPLGVSLSLRCLEVMVFVFEAMYPMGDRDLLAKTHPPNDPNIKIMGRAVKRLLWK
jgi:hypothetical protein